GCAAEGQEEHGGDLSLADADAAGDTGLVVISHDPIRPVALWKGAFVLIDSGGNLPGIPRQADEHEIKRQVRLFLVGAVIGYQAVNREIDLGDHETFLI